MAKSDKVVKRGIYLYLDGSEIKNDIKSVETEMKGLISAQKKMTLGSEEYVRTAQKIRTLKGIIGEHNAQLKAVEANVKKNTISVGKLADGFNRFFGLIGAGLAALTGFTLAIRTLRDEKNKLEESQAGLKALTGLDDESISWLTGQAKTLSTTMTKEGLRVRQSANEILDAYMLIGSAKPELLGNKEALASVTEEAMRLQAAAKDITLNEAVDALTLSLNQYSEGADKAAQFTNVLAAGSQAGSANIASEAKAIRVAGVAAASANTSIEQTVGLIQTLAYRGIKDEIAGTGLKKFFLTLQTGSDDTNPKIVGLTTALDNLQKKQMDAAAIKKMFGEEGYNVASVLISETAQVKEFTKAVTGTNIATEQAAINSNTAAAKLAQAKNELKLAGIELADRLNPAISVSTNMVTNLIKYLPGLIDWFKQWGGTILLITGTVFAYGAIIKVVNAYQIISNTLVGAARVLSLKLTIAKLAETTNFTRLAAATKLYNLEMAKSNILVTSGIRITNLFKAVLYSLQIAYYTLTFQMGKAKGAMVAFNMVSKMNPYVLLISAIMAVGAAIYLFTRRVDASIKAQKDLNDINKKVGEGIAEEKSKIDLLLTSIHNSNVENAKRIESINELKKIIPGYNAEISREGIIINENTEAIKAYMVQLEKEMRMSAASEKLRELYRQQFERREKVNTRKIELEALNKEFSNQDNSSPDYGGYRAMGRSSNLGAVRRDLKKEEQELKDVDIRIENLKSYYGSLIESSSSFVEVRTIQTVTKELENAKNVLEKLKKTNTEMFTPGELIVYDDKLKNASFSIVKLQSELKKLNEEKKKEGSGTGGTKGDDDKKNVFLKVESEYNKKREELKKKYLSGEIKTQEEYNRKAEELELQLLNDKLKVAGVEPTEREKITQQILDAKIKTMQELAKLDESLYVSPEEKNRRELEQVQKKYDGIRQIIEKAYSMGIIPTIEEKNKILANIDAKQAEESKKANEVIAEGRLKKKDEALAKEVLLLQERRIAERMTDKQYQEEFKKLNLEYIAEKLRIVGLSEEKIAELKKQGLDIQLDDLDKSLQQEKERQDIYKTFLEETAMSMGETLGDLFSGSEDALSNFLKNTLVMLLDSLEKVIQLSIAETTAKSIAQGPVGWAAAAGKILAIKMAFAAAKAAIGNFYDGGYTPGGAWNKPQGVVHSNEFVSNRFAVSNPNLRPVFDLIDYAQKSNSVANLTGADIAAVLPSSVHRKNANEGSNPTAQGYNSDSINPAIMAMLQECTQTMRTVTDRFKRPILSETYATGKRGTIEAENLVNKMKSNISRNSLKP